MYEETHNKTVRVKKWRQPKHPTTDITLCKLGSNPTMEYYANDLKKHLLSIHYVSPGFLVVRE